MAITILCCLNLNRLEGPRFKINFNDFSYEIVFLIQINSFHFYLSTCSKKESNVMIKHLPYILLQVMKLLSSTRTCLQMSKRLLHGRGTPGSDRPVSHKRVIPRRALMYVPGSDERKLNKIRVIY